MSKITDKDLAMFIAEANGHIFTMDDDSYVDYCATLAPELAMEVRELRRWKVDAERSLNLMATTIELYKERLEDAEFRAMGDNL